MTDEEDRVAVGRIPARLDVHLAHERAGGVDRVQSARLRVRVDGRRDPVRGQDDRLALGHLALVLDEDRTTSLEVANDVCVVDYLLADVDGRPVQVEQSLDGVHCPFDAGAVAARGREEDAIDHGVSLVRSSWRRPQPGCRFWVPEPSLGARRPGEQWYEHGRRLGGRRAAAAPLRSAAPPRGSGERSGAQKREARRSGGQCGGPPRLLTAAFVARYAQPRFASPSGTTVPRRLTIVNRPCDPSLQGVKPFLGSQSRSLARPTGAAYDPEGPVSRFLAQ